MAVHEFSWGVATHPGQVRSVNQDAVLAGPDVFVVADGMGGHAAGDVASSLAVAAFAGISEAEPLTVDAVLAAVAEANGRILGAAGDDARRDGMGTTVALVARCVPAVGRGEQLLIANVGDSRVYRHSAGVLEQLSTDHSVVAELLASGEITADEVESHPERHAITRALGLLPVMEVEWQLAAPTTGDRYLVCSDGLTNEVSDEELRDLLGSSTPATRQAQLLLDLALARGARDNVSVVVIDVGPVRVTTEATEVTVPAAAPEDTRPREEVNR